jgi:hypothetical protein
VQFFLNCVKEVAELSAVILNLKQAGNKAPKDIIACLVFLLTKKIFSINRLVLSTTKVQTVELLFRCTLLDEILCSEILLKG